MAGVGAADLVTGARLVAAPLLPLVARRRGTFAALAGASAGVAAVRGAAAVVGTARWGRPVLLHTWSDEAAGAAAVAGLADVVPSGRRGPALAAVLVAAGAAVEELWQVLAARAEPDVDAPGALGSLTSPLVARGRRSTTASGPQAGALGYDVS